MRQLAEKMLDQRGDVVPPLTQRRNSQVDDVEPEIQVFAKRVGGDVLPHVAVGCGDDAHVEGAFRTVDADPLNLAAFEEPQQYRLHPQAHFAHFVEKHRAAVRRGEQAVAIALRVRKAATHMAEQLGFEERIGDAGAIDGDERRAAASAQTVDQTRDNFLPDTAFARDQDFRPGTRGRFDVLAQLAHRRCGAHEAEAIVHGRTLQNE